MRAAFLSLLLLGLGACVVSANGELVGLALPVERPPHPPPFPRACGGASRAEDLTCAYYGFALLATPNPGGVGPSVRSELGWGGGPGYVRGGSLTACGCIEALAAKADWLADNNYRAEVRERCHCARPRD
ncbi:MAG: hypothetical protein ACYDCL_17770 [Myxococcales bacterium]